MLSELGVPWKEVTDGRRARTGSCTGSAVNLLVIVGACGGGGGGARDDDDDDVDVNDDDEEKR